MNSLTVHANWQCAGCDRWNYDVHILAYRTSWQFKCLRDELKVLRYELAACQRHYLKNQEPETTNEA